MIMLRPNIPGVQRTSGTAKRQLKLTSYIPLGHQHSKYCSCDAYKAPFKS